ncbi:PAS domain S-box protein [Fibrella sp. USSR17]
MTNPSTPFPFWSGNEAEQDRLRYAIQAAQLGTWNLDVGRQQLWWDERCRELYGFQGEDVIAYQQLLALVHADDQPLVDEAIKAALDLSSSGHYDVQFRTVDTPDNLPRWLHAQGQAYVDILGAAYRLSGVVQDITAQVQTRQQLEISKARFRSIVLNSPIPTVLFVGREMVIDTVNEPMLQIWGKDESVTGQVLQQVMPEVVSQLLLERLRRIYDTGDVDQASQARVVVDGHRQDAWYNFSYSPVYTQDGTIFGFINTATDVTGEVLALRELQRSEIRFRSLIEEAPVATCLLMGHNLRIEVANESILTAFGREKDVIGLPLIEALPQLRNQPFLAMLGEIISSGLPYSAQGARADYFIDGLEGAYYVDFTAKPLIHEQGDVYAILLMATDVTQQVLAQQVIKRSEAQKTFLLHLTDQLRTLSTPEAVYYQAACLLGTYLGASRVGYVTLQGSGETAPVGKQYTNEVAVLSEDCHSDVFGPILPELLAGRTVIYADIATDPALTEEQKQTHLTLQTGATVNKPMLLEGNLSAILFVHFEQAHTWTTDELMLLDEACARLIIAADRAVAEQALRESEHRYRLLSEELEHRVQQRTSELVQTNQDLKRSNENLQQFAYIASHDLQEPLRKIQSFGDIVLTQTDTPLDEQSRFMLKRMIDAGNRMSALVSDLLAFSRIKTRQETFGEVSLQKVIAKVLDTLDLAIEQTKASIHLQALPRINGDETQLGQLFQNLLSNALKFIPLDRNPIISITVEQRNRAELQPELHPSSQADEFYEINVTDNGIGFDPKYLARIFQVFQRLHGKNHYPGTGIGLAICQRVVDNHGGAITASSQVGQGATFTIYLPK